jgi:tetrahydromethanopterin S-methyltransferase subunit F
MKTDENNNPYPVNENSGTGNNQKVINDNEKKSRGEGIKKGVVTTSIIGFLLLLVAAIVVYSLYKRDHNKLLSLMETQKNTLTEKITARDSVISEWITTFDEIEKNIAMIKEKEKIISINSSDAELSRNKKQQVIEDIKYINSLLEENKKKIASLNAQLKKSGGTIKALQNKIAELEASMQKSENEISELKSTLVSKNFEIEQLNTEKTGLQSTIVQKDEKITSQTNEMNKAFYAFGTYKELKAKGLLTKEGGFIGLGKTKSLAENFSDSSLIQIDLSVFKSIPVNSKTAKLISEHPANSFEFLRDKDKKVVSLEIKDPGQFWKISKYAVVLTTK